MPRPRRPSSPEPKPGAGPSQAGLASPRGTGRSPRGSSAFGAGPSQAGLAPRIIAWQREAGRHDLPWQQEDPARRPLRDPYRVWLSEVMLQQTQVATATPYFHAFLAAFPTVAELAAADSEAVMTRWSGLGYYSRARNLHAAAKRIVAEHGGRFPASAQALAELPGIGRSTAAAIAVFAFGERAAILDGNVRRVFSRVFAIDADPASRVASEALWAHAEAELPAASTPASSAPAIDLIDYTQGLMDLGATCCTRRRPACERCPIRSCCRAFQADAVDRYPVPKPKRTVPLRVADLLAVRTGGHVLVELRPQRGIWGGLRSLPELRPPQAVPAPSAAGGGDADTGDGADTTAAFAAQTDALLRRLGLAASGALQPVARLSHTFTHFRLEATVWAIDVACAPGRLPPLAADDALRWLAMDATDDAPLPGPVRTLIRDALPPLRL